MSSHTINLYMAGPDVFFKNALEIAAEKKKILNDHGLMGHHPFDNSVNTNGLNPQEIAQVIFTENIAMMDRCDIILANLTPFRGPSADVGTVFELGYMFASKKPIFGYSNVDKTYLERIEEYNGAPLTYDDEGIIWDHESLNVENFNLRDNLMIDCAFVDQARAAQKSMTDHTASTNPMTAFRDFVASPCSKNEIYSDLGAFTAQVKNISKLIESDSL